MCGIGGYFLKTGPALEVPQVLQTFSTALRHRGPDDEGYLLLNDDFNASTFGGVDTAPGWFELAKENRPISTAFDHRWRGGFVHRRLSIMDLSLKGHQPYRGSQEGWLTYNGEIYNYRTLMPDFKSPTDSDTSVLVAFLEQGGLRELSRLDGMFAFAWLSNDNQELTLVRDRMGVKPLYYLDTPCFFAFASEPVVLHRLLQRNPDPDRSLILDYLVRGIADYEGPGFWKPVQELHPGYQLTYSLQLGEFKLKQWFNPYFLETYSPVEARRQLNEALTTSVQARLRSDVPLGCSLSGGLDSGLVTALAQKQMPQQPLWAFTATWPGQPENEATLAKKVAGFVGANWVEISLETRDLESYWGEITRIQGLPLIHTSTLAQGKVMQTAAANGVKVMLDGQGGDELFGGYYHHSAVYHQSFKYLIKNLLEIITRSIYPSWRYLKHPLGSCWNGELPHGVSVATYRVAPSLPDLLKQEAFGQPLKNLFRWADRSGMAYSIESRFPLADSITLQPIAFSLLAHDLIQSGWSKLALRKVAQGLLPDEVVWNHEKSAYGSPQHQWVVTSHQEWLKELHPNMADYLDLDRVQLVAKDLIDTGKSDSLFRIKALSEWMKQFCS